MRLRISACAVLAAAGFACAFTLASNASGALACDTDTAAEVAAATPTNLGYAWSSPEHPDPLWDVELPDLHMSLSVYAADAAGARVAAKTQLDKQVAALGCTTTVASTTEATSTVAPATATETVTETETRMETTTQPVVVVVPSPAATVTRTETATVTTATEHAPTPVNVNVTVHLPSSAGATVNLGHAVCVVARKRVPCSRLSDGHLRRVYVVATWQGKRVTVRKVVASG